MYQSNRLVTHAHIIQSDVTGVNIKKKKADIFHKEMIYFIKNM